MKHIHHIIPKHMGGTDDPSNLVELTVEEHAQAHLTLYEEYGNELDRVAYEALSGMIGSEEVIHQVLSESGKRGGANGKGKTPWNKGKKIGTNQKLIEYHKTRVLTEEQREKLRQGGRNSGPKNKGRKRPDLTKRNLERDYSNQKRGSNGKFV